MLFGLVFYLDLFRSIVVEGSISREMLFGLVFYLDLFRSIVVEGSNPLKGNAFWNPS